MCCRFLSGQSDDDGRLKSIIPVGDAGILRNISQKIMENNVQ